MRGVCDMHVHTNPDLRLRAYNDFELAEEMEKKTGMPVPDAVRKLKDAKIRHTTVCVRSEMKKQIRSFLQLTDE
jgi:threonine synthase